jgi:predicted GNAT family N-acyltransferase
MTENFEIKLIEFGTDDYKQSVNLREQILRKPLGLSFREEFLSADKFEIIIGLFINNQIVGSLNLKPLSNRILKMRQVAVKNTMQNMGIGKKIVIFSENYAKENKYTEIMMHARTTAVDFYKKLNYFIEGDEFFEVGILHYKMRKIL